MMANMEKVLLQPAFFGPISHYVLFACTDKIVFEIQDNFQKQTYRNRCYVYGPNGRQLLTVPVRHSGRDVRQKTREVRIDNSFHWQKVVVKSLEAAYRSSPFFEFYEDEILPVFSEGHELLKDLNLHAFQVVCNCLQLDPVVEYTETYEEACDPGMDFRKLIDAKRQENFAFTPYTQVFGNKHGFLPNLSILDLIFNEGTNALAYLRQHRSIFT
jgi:hypothetical protein